MGSSSLNALRIPLFNSLYCVRGITASKNSPPQYKAVCVCVCVCVHPLPKCSYNIYSWPAQLAWLSSWPQCLLRSPPTGALCFCQNSITMEAKVQCVCVLCVYVFKCMSLCVRVCVCMSVCVCVCATLLLFPLPTMGHKTGRQALLSKCFPGKTLQSDGQRETELPSMWLVSTVPRQPCFPTCPG